MPRMSKRFMRPICWVFGHRDFKWIDSVNWTGMTATGSGLHTHGVVTGAHYECMRCGRTSPDPAFSLTFIDRAPLFWRLRRWRTHRLERKEGLR